MKEEKQKFCVRCFYIADEKDLYCIKCGAPLENRCSDTKTKGKHGCGHINRPEASYCAKCGCETLFKKYGLV